MTATASATRARLVVVEPGRSAGLDRAEPAGPGARVAQDHDRRRALVPALPDVGAAGLLADRVERQAPEQALEVVVVVARGHPRADPVGVPAGRASRRGGQPAAPPPSAIGRSGRACPLHGRRARRPSAARTSGVRGSWRECSPPQTAGAVASCRTHRRTRTRGRGSDSRARGGLLRARPVRHADRRPGDLAQVGREAEQPAEVRSEHGADAQHHVRAS